MKLGDDLLSRAVLTAQKAHGETLDKSGKLYFIHPLEVMFKVRTAFQELRQQYPDTRSLARIPEFPYSEEEIMAAAVLHDVVEDCPEYSFSYIVENFGDRVATVVDGVTRKKGEVYSEFIKRAALDVGSRLVKKVDVTVNLGRIGSLPENERSIEKRYRRALDVLG